MLIYTFFSLLLWFLFTTQIIASRRKGELKEFSELKNDWTGKWFPFDPKKTLPPRKLKSQLDLSGFDMTKETSEWNLKWFPFDPKKPPAPRKSKPQIDLSGLNIGKETKDDLKNKIATSKMKQQTGDPGLNTVKKAEDWNLKWFPLDPKKTPTKSNVESQTDTAGVNTYNTSDSWNLKWFPFKTSNSSFEKSKTFCDDGQNSIEGDFDPKDKRHSLNYLCLSSRRSLYEPNFSFEAVIEEQFIPPTFVPHTKCLNESISYESPLSTFGAFRPIPPQFGTYLYLPKQRWLHSIARGAIVMLYHPCASQQQVKTLQHILQNCLYRHIVTPSQALSPQRPLALLTWGKMLSMSVVDKNRVINFIKTNSKHGPLSFKTTFDPKSLYLVGLVSEAKLITDFEDKEICGFFEA